MSAVLHLGWRHTRAALRRDPSTYTPRESRREGQQRRRLAFIRAQRLSTDEAAYIHPQFDPGPEYD